MSRPSSAQSSPNSLGFTLPHQHTQIALWHIQDRWDYWQLTRDEPVILEELARFRAVGGSGLVDLTLPGVGRDPVWLRGVAAASGLHIVMGCGWYRDGLLPARGADRPPLDRRPRRRADRGRSRSGWGRPACAPGSSARSAPTSRGSRPRRSASTGRPPGPPDGPGWPSGTHAVLSDVGLAQLRIFEEEGHDPGRVVVGHADSYPVLEHYLAIVERGASPNSTSSACPGSASGSVRTGPSSCCASCCRLATRTASCSARTSATIRRWVRFGGNGYAYLAKAFLPRLRAAGVGDAEIETMTVTNPRRLLTIG